MLSKSQARFFFIFGTVLFSVIFLGLTVDTLQKIPEQTKTAHMDAPVIRGKILWEKNNCMGCHTLMGEGGYYAPELTKVYERRGPEWMKVFLKDPQAMFPGERKMVKYPFTDQDLEDLVAFFKWIGEMDLNGFPAKPPLAQVVAQGAVPLTTTASPPAPMPEKFKQLCMACHVLGGTGGKVGPALDGVGKKFDAAYLEGWLSDPQAIKPGTAMPKLPLSEAERSELVHFLGALQ